MNVTASQVRQDLNCFGGFGQQGYGYSVSQLKEEIKNILGLNNAYKAILIGAGNLGKAVAMHMNFEKLGFELVEPVKYLFKDEVRQAGRELGLPEYLVSRQPFPGPGLGIRIIGEVTPEKVAIVQDADAIWREEIAKAGLDKEISQYYAALTNMHSVGVMGDERTYDYAIALRAVQELALSLPLLIVCHPVLAFLHRKFTL